MANLNGTEGDDVISFSASSGQHSINGLGGDDLVILDFSGVAGDLDTFNSGGVIRNYLEGPQAFSIGLGSVERVNITTGAGNDYLYLFGGDDVVVAGGGNDIINTRTGRASVSGGTGTDHWIADLSAYGENGLLDLSLAGPQAFKGGTIRSIERVTLTLGSGNDTVLTRTGAAGAGLDDTINAGAGDDVVRLGGGRDLFYAGEGNDLVIIELGDQTAGLRTFNSGGAITNDLTGVEAVAIGLGSVERVNITTGSGNDQLHLFAGDDVVSSGGGNDDINTRSGRASVDGGAGIDVWTADLSALNEGGTLDLGAGAQNFLGGTIVNVERLALTLGNGNHAISTLTGVAGAGLDDSIVGGAGDDVIRVGGGRDNVSGGLGFDVLIVDLTGTTGDFYTTNSGAAIRNSLTGSDEVVVGQSGFERLQILGGGGNDNFFAQSGDDIVDGGAGNDVLLGNNGNDTLSGGIGDDELRGGLGNDSMLGDDGDDDLFGDEGDDTLSGGNGMDILNGGTGADAMSGGSGDDTYIVDNLGDTVMEAARGGRDLVLSGVSFGLGAGVEDLTLTGSAAIDGTGNTGANRITGNGAANTLLGGNGDDVLIGGGGNDVLNGGGKADRMEGGTGNDTYYVDNVGDVIVELAGQGDDWIYSTISINVNGTDIERVTLTGSAAVNATGNALNNTMTGNAKANVLSGGAGVDTISGGAGLDTLIGGEGNDVLDGGGGGDRLIGGIGADLLTGGQGADTFVFQGANESRPGASDRITDLQGADRIDLSAIDANNGVAGDQAFVRVEAFSNAAGQLMLSYSAGSNTTTVSADVNGDGVADFAILLTGDQTSYDNFIW